MLTLTHNCGVMIEDGQLQVKKSTNKYITFFSQMFEPFLLGYWVNITLDTYRMLMNTMKCSSLAHLNQVSCKNLLGYWVNITIDTCRMLVNCSSLAHLRHRFIICQSGFM